MRRHFTATGFVVQGSRTLLHWHKRSQKWLPPGGHIEPDEDPVQAILREIREETGVEIDHDDLRMMGLVSERAYEGEGHWLIFLFEVTRPIRHEEMKWTEFEEGLVEWKQPSEVADLDIPRTDRDVMWPLVQSHRGGFFMVHIDWSETDLTWTVHESVKAHPADGC